MFIIKHWAGNILDFKGRFKDPQLSTPMTFKSFEDAQNWIYKTFEYSGEGAYEQLISEFVVEELEAYGEKFHE